jgi:phospholipid/cholesterol/gamma-HCH transport system substrate-binding protein
MTAPTGGPVCQHARGPSVGEEQPSQMRSVSGVGRVAAIGAVIAAVALVAIVLFGGASDPYNLKARFLNAGQLVKGNPVQTGGVPIGSVTNIEITDQGQAEIEFEIQEDYAPLRRGARATIRQ